jgi:hypothetical protein
MDTRERENIAKGQDRKLALILCFRCELMMRKKIRILLSSGNNNCKGSKSETERTERNIHKGTNDRKCLDL